MADILEALKAELASNILNNDTLRQAMQVYGFDRLVRTIRSYTIAEIQSCSDCSMLCYSSTLKIAYSGRRCVCDKCSVNYTYCSKCASLILIKDTLMHFHVTTLMQRRGENEVLPFNHDVSRDRKPRRAAREGSPMWGSTRYFGIEIELERILESHPPDLILKATSSLAKGFGFAKHDGSLSAAPGNPHNGSNGFELVTLPATMKYHKEEAGWETFFEVLGPWMQERPNTAGLHIHVSSNSVTPATIGRIVKFINSPANLGFLIGIAGRDFTQPNPNGRPYSQVFPNVGDKVNEVLSRRKHEKNCPESPAHRTMANFYGVNGGVELDSFGHPKIQRIKSILPIKRCACPSGNFNYAGHYAAFNLRTGKPTIEFRMFQGSTNRVHFLSCLDFVDALIRFCESTSFSSLTADSFVSWVKINRHLYRDLSRWLVILGLMDPPKEKK